LLSCPLASGASSPLHDALMMPSPHTHLPARRFPGTILLIGNGTPELLRAMRALEPLAETTLVSPADASNALARLDADVIVADECGSDGLGHRLLAESGALHPSAVRILLGRGDTGRALLEAIDATLIPKPVDPRALHAAVTLGLQCASARRTARDLENDNHRLRGLDAETAGLELDDVEDLERYEGVLYRSPAMKQVVNLIRRIDGSDTTVLVHGETGTGKELIAQAIHARSRRRNGRFVAVNLGAISDHLRESELFGHVRGAFTGATENRAGLFMEANGGCIFLDEVADASPGLQVALLRVLEEGTITPVGSDRSRRVDVRVISGTNRNLDEMVALGLLRRDLYYRLNVFPVELPPLRARAEDIYPLALHFLARASLAMGKKPPGISREARAVLETYHWEGNVRELRNVMERAAILCKGGLVVPTDLPVACDRKSANGNTPTSGTSITIPPGGASLQQLEREIFVKTLALVGGNQTRAARILGLRESTFRFRMQKLGVTSRRGGHAANGSARAARVQSDTLPSVPAVASNGNGDGASYQSRSSSES
jgi:DNA-binding NtrC family response regulator